MDLCGTSPPHWLALDLGGNRTVNGFIIRLPGRREPTTTMLSTIDQRPGRWKGLNVEV